MGTAPSRRNRRVVNIIEAVFVEFLLAPRVKLLGCRGERFEVFAAYRVRERFFEEKTARVVFGVEGTVDVASAITQNRPLIIT